MTDVPPIALAALDLDLLAETEGRIAVFVGEGGKLDPAARRLDRLTRGALRRFVDSPDFRRLKEADVRVLDFPTGLAAVALIVGRIERRSKPGAVRRLGAAIGKKAGSGRLTLCAGHLREVRALIEGAALGAYRYEEMRRKPSEDGDKPPLEILTLVAQDKEGSAEMAAAVKATVSGVYFARDLTNAPANVLTTTAFADALLALRDTGLDVEIMDEDRLHELGMNTLLAVGQGSDAPSKVVTMRWKGGGSDAPLAIVGKGVCFDTGGISIKPAGGMEDMTGDMGGAGVVAGVMKTLAMRNARANVTGIVGLVENMPDGRAMRPGDVVVSMKGDTVEIINTDAEGRLVLCDLLWHAQKNEDASEVIDLATLTGAIVVALGHEHAGVFSNDDALAAQVLKAAGAEGEGAWRMPLGDAYAELLKSRVADIKNVGGRPAGAITAAEFLHRFIDEGTAWVHLDIAGVASTASGNDLAHKGATGWGVRMLDRMIRDTREGD